MTSPIAHGLKRAVSATNRKSVADVASAEAASPRGCPTWLGFGVSSARHRLVRVFDLAGQLAFAPRLERLSAFPLYEMVEHGRLQMEKTPTLTGSGRNFELELRYETIRVLFASLQLSHGEFLLH